MKKVALFTLVTVITGLIGPIQRAEADVSGCTASVSPTSMNANLTGTLAFAVSNEGESDAIWVKITAPSDNFQVLGGNSSGWSVESTSQTAEFTGGVLAGRESKTFNVSVQTGVTPQEAASWEVLVADTGDGSGATSCSGDTAVSIGGDTTPPAISAVTATNVTQTSASITWTTDEAATTVVRYGTSTTYGTTKQSSSLTTSHTMSVTGLTAGTIYHYQVESRDGTGNTSTSNDKVFTTAEAGTTLAISNVSTTNVSTSSATITWTTTLAASTVLEYGLTSGYGGNYTNSTLTTSHSVTLTGLSANTTYHFKAKSSTTTASAESGDNTFKTSTETSSDDGDSGGGGGGGGDDSDTSSSTTTTNTATQSSATTKSNGGTTSSNSEGDAEPVVGVVQDTTPPSISLTSTREQVYAQAPTLTGIAKDNISVRSVAYSLDDGKNWIGIQGARGLGTGTATFSFTPVIKDDDNYALRLRAIDSSGNVGFSQTYTLVLDTIPPAVGSAVYTTGAQLLTDEAVGITAVVAGLDQEITVSAVGGAIKIEVIARPINGGEEQVFALTKNEESGLWSGTISLSMTGEYELTFRAQDGANNVTERVIQRIKAITGSQVLMDGEPVEGAEVTIWIKEAAVGYFEPWSAEVFQQINPQTTGEKGEFRYMLPPGTYYVTVTAPRIHPVQTEIFTLTESVALQIEIPVQKQKYIDWGIFHIPVPPKFWKETVSIQKTDETVTETTDIAVAEENSPVTLDWAQLQVWGDEGVKTLAELQQGETVIISFLVDWAPQAGEQLSYLNNLSAEEQERVIPILVQASAIRAHALKIKGNYQIPIYADPTGETATALHADTVPMQLVIDEKGQIVQSKTGLTNTNTLSAWLKMIY